MIDLSKRSYQKELLDAEGIPFSDIVTVMKELNSINTRLGGHAITVEGVKKLAAGRSSIHVCEIGCGGGDNLNALQEHFSKKGITLQFTGIDIKQECLQFAEERYPNLKAAWICSDYKEVDFGSRKPDIIFSSLFTHHFTDDELVEMLRWQKINSGIGFFSNDLQRSALAYYLIKWLTAAFSRSALVKNDACLSVARSFRRADWYRIAAAAIVTPPEIQWRWAFRYLTLFSND